MTYNISIVGEFLIAVSIIISVGTIIYSIIEEEEALKGGQ